MVHEYRYRKMFGLSHAEFLAEPRGLVPWMLSIDDIASGRDDG
jgi:hypothetical protein